MPNTYKYMIWDWLKSFLYLLSIYSLWFLAAFRFQKSVEWME